MLATTWKLKINKKVTQLDKANKEKKNEFTSIN